MVDINIFCPILVSVNSFHFHGNIHVHVNTCMYIVRGHSLEQLACVLLMYSKPSGIASASFAFHFACYLHCIGILFVWGLVWDVLCTFIFHLSNCNLIKLQSRNISMMPTVGAVCMYTKLYTDVTI